jgi:transposase
MSQPSFEPSLGNRAAPEKHLPKGAAYDYAVRSRVIKMSKSGMSSNKISADTGIDATVIRRWIRRYREFGPLSLQPYWHSNNRKDSRTASRAKKDKLFRDAYETYATTREPVASITRRFGLDYHSFKYHVERHHPELVKRRGQMKLSEDNK